MTNHQNLVSHDTDIDGERGGDSIPPKSKEAIRIHTHPAVINQDPGPNMYLSWIYDQVFVDIPKINGNSRGLNGTSVGIGGRNCKH